jgi:hypothetical protein
MPNRSSKKKNDPKDVNELAFSIVDDLTSERPAEEDQSIEPEKDPAAVALGRKGGLKGGKARAAKLSKKKRSEIAKKAARARWSKTK